MATKFVSDPNQKIISRNEAIKQKLKTYFTGRSCPQGHYAPRWVAGYACTICTYEIVKERQESNPEATNAYARKWYNDNIDKCRANLLRSYYKNRDERLVRMREFQKTRPEYMREWQNVNYRENIQHKLRVILRSRLKNAIRNGQKSGSAVADLGCTIEFLKDYLETQFRDGMTWENWGIVWEIDHIEQLAHFDLNNRAQLLRAFHYSNLRPLLKIENRSRKRTRRK